MAVLDPSAPDESAISGAVVRHTIEDLLRTAALARTSAAAAAASGNRAAARREEHQARVAERHAAMLTDMLARPDRLIVRLASEAN